MTQTDIRIKAYRSGRAAEAWEWPVGRLLQGALASFIHVGTLRVVTSGGDVFTVGDGSGKRLAIRLASATAQLGVLLDPDLKFGEAYMNGTLVVEGDRSPRC